jgi:hypothetical protein
MQYLVMAEQYDNAEFRFSLIRGDLIEDGDIEPDLMAELVSQGVIAPAYETTSTAEVTGPVRRRGRE